MPRTVRSEETPCFRVGLLREPGTVKRVFRSAVEVMALCRDQLEGEPFETVLVLCMDSDNNVIGIFKPYRGGITQTLIEPRGVFVPALLMNAYGVVVAHNHPNGDPSPSQPDCDMTKRLLEAGAILGVVLHDHYIVGDDQVFSFRRELEQRGIAWES